MLDARCVQRKARLMTLSAPPAGPALDELCVSTPRFLAVDMVQQANSGHPGLPLRSAALAYALDRSLRFNPRDPMWPDRDRFVLSAGHGCALFYGAAACLSVDNVCKRARDVAARVAVKA